MYTIKDIASEVGVSPTTVSLVLNNRTCRISEATRQKILETAEKNNYSPNYSARALVMRQTRTLGLIIPDISNPYFSELAKGVEREAQKQGYSVIFCNSGENGRKDVENLRLLLSRQVEAVVLVSSIQDEEHQYANEFNRLASASQTPVVQFDRQVIGGNYDIVSIDNRMGGYLAAKFLLMQGYTQVGCITGPLQQSSARERFEGYLDALKEQEIPRNDALISHGDYTMQSGLMQAQKLLANGADAIFACNDLMAIGVVKALRQHGRQPGVDFGVVGFDNSPICEYLETPLTSIDQNIYDMGKTACRLAIDQINRKRQNKGRKQQPTCQTIRFSPSLVIRETANRKR